MHVQVYSTIFCSKNKANKLFFAVKDLSRIKPILLKANVGDDVEVFICDSAGPTKWFYESGSLHSNAQPISTNNNVLRIDRVTYMDGGLYQCYGSYDQSLDHFVAMATLRVYGESFKLFAYA